MQLSTLLTEHTVQCGVQCSSKKRLLEIVSDILARQHNIPTAMIFETLCYRERMGSTGIGAGIALPHGKLDTQFLNQASGVFLKLSTPIHFDAVDNQPVDLLFAMLIPHGQCQQYQDILHRIAEDLSNRDRCRQLRAAKSDAELYRFLLNHKTAEHNAANNFGLPLVVGSN